jgi:hypothetical protein
MSKKFSSYPARLELNTGTTQAPAWTPVAGLTSITPPGLSVEKRDRTTHDSEDGVKEYGAGMIDVGSVSMHGFYDPTDASHSGANGLPAIAVSRATREWRIVLAAVGADEAIPFSGFVEAWTPGALAQNNDMEFDAAIAVSGLPGYA